MLIKDVLTDIRAASASARRKYGGRLEDYYAEGLFIYARCLKFHDRRRPFDRYFRHKLKREIQKMIRRERTQAHGLRRGGKIAILNRVPLRYAANKPAPIDWTDELSDEAMKVAKLALQSRPDMKPWQIRNSIRNYLLRIGRTMDEVASTFKEIADAI